MELFLNKPRTALGSLADANLKLQEQIDSAIPSHQLPRSRLNALEDLCEQIPARLAALSQSLDLIEKTSLDIVDMETRMQNESGKLADVLGSIGEAVRGQYFVKKYFENQLLELEEAANQLASGLFPSAVQGLNMVNSKLWEFTNLQWVVYQQALERVKSKLSEMQHNAVDTRFRELRKIFDALNGLLNDLALRRILGSEIGDRFHLASSSLTDARKIALAAADLPEFREFRSILKESAKIADALQQVVRAVKVPLFPAYSEIEEMRTCISESKYSDLTGLQIFALLNIGSRMRHIRLKDQHLLSPEFEVEIFDAHPDRIYLSAKPSFLDAIRDSGIFAPADSSLHRYTAGSFKEKSGPSGNLQISHSSVQQGRVFIDVDIDLYRDPVLHLFGEVLRNHLTGRKTDAYEVRSILDEQGVAPIGGFRIYSS